MNASSPCTGRGEAGRWLKPPQLADLLGMSTDWVQTKVTEKSLPHHKVGRLTRFCPECVARIQRGTCVVPSEPARLRKPA